MMLGSSVSRSFRVAKTDEAIIKPQFRIFASQLDRKPSGKSILLVKAPQDSFVFFGMCCGFNKQRWEGVYNSMCIPHVSPVMVDVLLPAC